MACNNYLAPFSCPACGSVTRYLSKAGTVCCNNCGEPTGDALATLEHGGRFCTCAKAVA